MSDTESAIPRTDPFVLFDEWFAKACEQEPNDPNAFALATATADGRPSVRMVLLKEHGPEEGFIFYTNAESRKGEEIETNMRAAMLFHWKSLRRQIRIEGPLSEVAPGVADAYFRSRGRESQIGSAASRQSAPLTSRQTYLDRIQEIAAQYPEGDVPRPQHWTGFRLQPDRIEFWLDRPNRLHDRRLFVCDDANGDRRWSDTLLYP